MLIDMHPMTWQLDLGANFTDKKSTTFKVWAPHHLALTLQIEDRAPLAMLRDQHGYFHLEVSDVQDKSRYFYILENGLKRPDPVSRSLPGGVHGPTEIVSTAFEWSDHQWNGIDLCEYIFYEVHIGTFTPHGTFEGAIEKLDHLKNLGVNCLEIMPVAQFPGRWNWGYDGASLFAPFSGYGGVRGFKRLVDACHAKGISVCLDVVYNHLGPEGNYLSEFGPYFSDTYHTPWGKAFNYDGAYSDHVRDLIFKNALYWIVEYHIDALRLDAIDGIYDFSASEMVPELAAAVKKISESLGRKAYVIAESGLNDSRLIRPKEKGGWNLCGIWNDDFHHAAHVTLTAEKETYYQDFNGITDFSKALARGVVYDKKYSPFRKKQHGNSFEKIPYEKLIAFVQNHDQIGNRPLGERLTQLVSHERTKVAACMALMTPYVPLIFMGEEYGEKVPFEYFVDYADEQLMRSIFEGRKREFHRTHMPFPGKESFDNSCLTWKIDREIFSLHQNLLSIRKKNLPKRGLITGEMSVYHSSENHWVAWEYPTEHRHWIGVFCYLGPTKITIKLPFEQVGGELLLSTEDIKQKSAKEWQIPSECALVVK